MPSPTRLSDKAFHHDPKGPASSRLAAYYFGAKDTSNSTMFDSTSRSGPSFSSTWTAVTNTPYQIALWNPQPAAGAATSIVLAQDIQQTYDASTQATMPPEQYDFRHFASEATPYANYPAASARSAHAAYNFGEDARPFQTKVHSFDSNASQHFEPRSYSDYPDLLSPTPEPVASPPRCVPLSPLRARPTKIPGLLQSIECDDTPYPEKPPEVERYANGRIKYNGRASYYYGKEFVQMTEDELHQVRPDYGKMKRLGGFVNADKGATNVKGKIKKNVHLTFTEQEALNRLRIRAGKPALMRVKRSKDDKADWDKAARVKNAELEKKLNEKREDIRRKEILEAEAEDDVAEEEWGAEWR